MPFSRNARDHACVIANLWLLAMLMVSPAMAHEAGEGEAHPLDAAHIASFLHVKGKIPPPPAGVSDLKFREFFKLPVGPRGLEPTEKLLGLNGKRVRLLGYMVNAEEPSPGPFILAPMALSLAEKEDGPADDIPATVVFVHIKQGEGRVVPHIPGLLKLTGMLSVGSQEEPDGRVSVVRLQLDDAFSKNLLGKARPEHPKKKTS